MPEERKAELTGRIDAWHTAQQQRGASEPLHFEASLSAGERKFIHALCESRGTEMSSKSEGEGKERHVVVYDVPVEAGTVGGVSAARRAELESRLDAWRAGAMAAALHFEPGHLPSGSSCTSWRPSTGSRAKARARPTTAPTGTSWCGATEGLEDNQNCVVKRAVSESTGPVRKP